jgi:PPE-repeat protein
MDFGLLPPEVNSSLMYSGSGSGPMLAAGTAWDGLAAELHATATSYESVISSLTAAPWLGPASAAMASAATPYVAWMHTTSAQAAQTAVQAKAAAAAYEAAFAMTVPPPVIAANRALLMQLIATNILGQNTAVIAATQADYAEMWAQDAAAMYDYAGSSAAAAQLTPFTPPKQNTNPGGPADQTAAVAHATGTSTQNTLVQSMSAVPQTLQQLALPMQATPLPDPAEGVAASTALSGLSFGSVYHSAIGSVNLFQRLASQFTATLTSQNQPTTTDIMDRVDKIALATGAISDDELTPADGHLGLGPWQNWLGLLKNLGAHIGHASATASVGQASTVSGLSVPQSWAVAAPQIQLASAELPSPGIDAAPAVAEGSAGNNYADLALASMAGRALAGTVGPGGRAGLVRAATHGRAKSPGDSKPPRNSADGPETRTAAGLRDVPELIREFGKLRDSGLLTDEEFIEQKRRLLSPNPSPG